MLQSMRFSFCTSIFLVTLYFTEIDAKVRKIKFFYLYCYLILSKIVDIKQQPRNILIYAGGQAKFDTFLLVKAATILQ